LEEIHGGKSKNIRFMRSLVNPALGHTLAPHYGHGYIPLDYYQRRVEAVRGEPEKGKLAEGRQQSKKGGAWRCNGSDGW